MFLASLLINSFNNANLAPFYDENWNKLNKILVIAPLNSDLLSRRSHFWTFILTGHIHILGIGLKLACHMVEAHAWEYH